MSVSITWVDADGNVLVLTDPENGVRVLRGAIGLDVPPVSMTLADYVATDGATKVKSRIPSRPLVLPLYIYDSLTIHSRVGDIARAFRKGGALVYDNGSTVRTLLSVEYEGGMTGNRSAEESSPSWRKYPVAFRALNPWWHDEVQSETLSTAQSTAFDAAIDFDADVPFNGGDSTSFVVEGDATALPVWTITGPFSSLTVGVEGGQAFTLADPLADGDVITVDTRQGNRGPSLNGGPVDWSLLTPESRLWELPVGEPTVIAGAAGVDGGSAVTVAFRQRWLTP